jgi:hypothetical protein
LQARRAVVLVPATLAVHDVPQVEVKEDAREDLCRP